MDHTVEDTRISGWAGKAGGGAALSSCRPFGQGHHGGTLLHQIRSDSGSAGPESAK